MFSPKKEKKEGEVISVVKEKKIAIPEAKQIPQQWQDCPDDAIQLISDLLENKDAVSLALTSRFLYHNTKDSLLDRKLAQCKLAHYVVVEPNESKVRAILSKDPKLISVVIKKITDSSGRLLIDNTIFQLAYGAGDYEMCLAMKPFFIQVCGSEEAAIQEMERQRTKKFTEDKEADKQAKDHLAALLKPVIAAITIEQFNLGKSADDKLILSPATLTAIETFREKFAKSQPKRIEKGMHFHNNTLLETYNAYAQAAVQWDHDYNRCALFEDGVLSFVLLAVPANDAQRFSQGLYYLQNKGEPFGRSLALRVGKNNFYLVSRDVSADFSLTGTCVHIYDGEKRDNGWGVGGARMGLSKLMWNKKVKLTELMRLSPHADITAIELRK